MAFRSDSIKSQTVTEECPEGSEELSLASTDWIMRCPAVKQVYIAQPAYIDYSCSMRGCLGVSING